VVCCFGSPGGLGWVGPLISSGLYYRVANREARKPALTCRELQAGLDTVKLLTALYECQRLPCGVEGRTVTGCSCPHCSLG
jgi:hypothetical protein